MTIGDKIKELRKEQNMTQENLAEKLNVSRQTISKWESNISIPDANNIVLICKVFHIDTNYLLDYQNDKVIKRKQFVTDMIVLALGIFALIIFDIMLLTNKIDETTSTITINIYGVFCIIFLILIILFIIIMIKRYVKK